MEALKAPRRGQHPAIHRRSPARALIAAASALAVASRALDTGFAVGPDRWQRTSLGGALTTPGGCWDASTVKQRLPPPPRWGRARLPPALRGPAGRQAAGLGPEGRAAAAGRWPRWARLPLAALGALALGLLLLPRHAAASGTVVIEGPLELGLIAKFFAAGGVGCCLSHACATPFDVVKTRLQSDPDRYVHSRTGQPLSIFATGNRIIQEEGPGALCKGMKTTFFGYLLQGSVKYGLWETFKWELGFAAATGGTRILILVVAALIAEMFATLVLCPFERIRIRLVADASFAEGGLLAGLKESVKRDGVLAALYGDGLPATLVKQISYTVAKLTCYVLFSMVIKESLGHCVPRLGITLLSSLVAGFVAAVSSQPGDVLQVCTSTNSKLRDACPIDLDTGEPLPLWSLAKALGWQALFTGWRARLLHVEVIVVSQLLIYDALLHSMGI